MPQTIRLLLLAAAGINALSTPVNSSGRSAGGNIATNATVHASLSPINTTHCAVELINDGTEDLDFLIWNSLFDFRAESFSFAVQDTKTLQQLDHGPEMLRKIYTKVLPDHVLKLAAHSSWNGTYDLTHLFEVPTEGNYTVSLASTLTALSKTGKLTGSYNIFVKSQAVTMELSKSYPALKPRLDLSDNALIHTCDAAQQWVIQQAVQQATAMAANAMKAVPVFSPIVGYWPNQTLYQEYFNDNSQQTVFNVFKKVSGYSLTANPGFGVTFYCNTDATHSNYCSSQTGLVGYAPAQGAYSYVTLCNYFFTNVWSSTLCGQPGTSNPPAQTYLEQWQEPYMQAGIALHEMLHCYKIAGTNTIIDGPDKYNQGGVNYLYRGVSSLAQNAATNGDAPLTNSQNFVYFAQAVTNTEAPLPCNCCSFGGPTLSFCSGLPDSPACGACTCGGVDPNPSGS